MNGAQPRRDELRLNIIKKTFQNLLVISRDINIYIMTILLEVITNNITRYGSHPTVDIM